MYGYPKCGYGGIHGMPAGNAGGASAFLEADAFLADEAAAVPGTFGLAGFESTSASSGPNSESADEPDSEW